MKDTSVYRAKLERRLAELGVRLDKIEHSLDEPKDPDFEEQATQRENDEVLEELGDVGLSEIRQIHAALQRIASGEFGVCVNCGDEISAERLEAVPHAARCRNCA